MNKPRTESAHDQTYADLLYHCYEYGKKSTNRTGVTTRGLFGAHTSYNLSNGFPLLTTKRLPFRAICYELLWFLSGSTNVFDLLKHGVTIWNNDAYRHYVSKGGDLPFDLWGYRTYGSMWRAYPGVGSSPVDQIQQVINTLRTNPQDRRLIVYAWHPVLVREVALPPCPVLFQFHTEKKEDYTILNLQLYQRSCDLFLAVPFNIASYALLLHLVATTVGMVPGVFHHCLGDYHIYENHFSQVKTQLARGGHPSPKILIRPRSDIFRYTIDDINLLDYQCEPPIKAPLNTAPRAALRQSRTK